MCVVYRLINTHIIQPPTPLPRINEDLEKMREKHPKFLSSLDIHNKYYHMDLHDNSKEYTAFTTTSGKYHYNKSPNGLKSNPGQFLQLLSLILQGLHSGIAESYMNGILCLSQTFDEHITSLQSIFDKLRGANLKLSPTQCAMAQQSIMHQGHLIHTNGTIAIDPERTKIIRNYPTPTTTKQSKQCYNLFQYYRRFCKDFSEIEQPISNLLIKDVPFHWSPQWQTAFQN
jgi:hypothetical protein